ncbi:MAG: ABC transporter substrate-binding protein [Burkholderiales bacterium]
MTAGSSVHPRRSALVGGVVWWLALAGGVAAADLRIGMSADVTSIDPHFVNITPNNNVAWHVFEALTHVDADARLIPGLAESWRAVDATTWEFRLRRGVRFHDGSELTAEDVAFSIDRPATLTASPGPFTTFTRPIVSQQLVDRYTIRLKTAAPYAMVPYDMNSVFIVSRRAAAGATTEDFNAGKAAVGTGPYRFARFARGDRVELVRNDAYWGPKPEWDKVTFRIVPSDGARVSALLADEFDAIEYVPTPDLKRIRATPRFRLEQKVSWRTIFFTLDQHRDAPPGVTDKRGRPLGRNPFKDPRVREAIGRAINRQAIVDRVMDGAATPASNVVAPPVFGHVASLKPEGYDVEAARKLLAAAGYPEGFTLTLAAPNNRYLNDDQIAQAVAQMLARIGIEAKVATMPLAAYFPKARNLEFPFAMLGWGSFSGDLALRSLVMTYDADKGTGAWNWGRYSNPKVDRLVTQALATVDDAKREAFARAAMALAMADRPVILLHHQVATWAMRRELRYAARTDEYTFAHHFRRGGP